MEWRCAGDGIGWLQVATSSLSLASIQSLQQCDNGRCRIRDGSIALLFERQVLGLLKREPGDNRKRHSWAVSVTRKLPVA